MSSHEVWVVAAASRDGDMTLDLLLTKAECDEWLKRTQVELDEGKWACGRAQPFTLETRLDGFGVPSFPTMRRSAS
jgi:hypothetical protein